MNNQVNLEELPNGLVDDSYNQHLSSFEYIPKTFLDINTSLFGNSRNNPFLILKQKAQDESVNIEDRMQCVRYMCKIPFKDYITHSIDAGKTIILVNNYDPYKLFYFYANNDKYIKLDDHVVYGLHPTFLQRCVAENLPFELMMLVCKAIFITYPFDSDERTEVLEYVLNIADDVNESICARAECADLLFTFGEGDEIFFGKKIINQLGELYNENKIKTVWSNSQNVHTESIQSSVLDVVKTLHRKMCERNIEVTIEGIKESLIEHFTQISHLHSIEDMVNTFCYRILVDPSKYVGLTLFDIFVLVWRVIQESEHREELLLRLLEEIMEMDGTCSTGYLTRIVNVLSGYVESEELQLRLSPKDELRSAVFARVMARIRSQPDQVRNDLLEDLDTGDKMMFDEFMEIYSPYDELLLEYSKLLSIEEFNEIFNQCIKEFKLFAI